MSCSEIIIINTMENKECKECKKTDMSQMKVGIVILGFYLMGSSVYGTIVLIKNLIELFK